jgi:integrase
MAALIHRTRDLAQRYLAHRRRLGYLMRHASLLLDFARYADRTAPGRPLTTALALQWATLVPLRQADSHARRLGAVRGFARYCAALDPRAEVPPFRLLGPHRCRFAPHIYTAAQIKLILRRAARISARRTPLAPQTYTTLLGLIACTGLRIGEAVRLRATDFDPRAGTLLVPRTKFSPERLLPLHPSAVRALVRYANQRRRVYPLADYFFAGRRARPVDRHAAEAHFRGLVRGIKANGARPRPRIHDFRHTFATRLISHWSRSPAPVAHYLMLLSRYLGHQCFRDTWWYVSLDPRALAAAARSFADFRKEPRNHDHALIPPADPALLRRAPAGAAQPQPQHHRRLPRYLPPAPWLPRTALAQVR